MGTVLEVIAGEGLLSDLILDVLAEAHEKGGVASFKHNGKKKKGIVIGKKGEHLVVARGQERHMVKNGESQRMMEAAETVEPLEIDPVFVDSVLDEAAEAMGDDGTVDLSHPMVLERLTPRQLRFLFATGAFKAGKAAAKAVIASDNPRLLFGVGRPTQVIGSRGTLTTVRPVARAAAQQAMSQQLKMYGALKRSKLSTARIYMAKTSSRGKEAGVSAGLASFARGDARRAARAAVK